MVLNRTYSFRLLEWYRQTENDKIIFGKTGHLTKLTSTSDFSKPLLRLSVQCRRHFPFSPTGSARSTEASITPHEKDETRNENKLSHSDRDKRRIEQEARLQFTVLHRCRKGSNTQQPLTVLTPDARLTSRSIYYSSSSIRAYSPSSDPQYPSSTNQ